MQPEYLYMVTRYGCNSGAHCMWRPVSKTFKEYSVAYEYFLTVAPSLTDPDNRAEGFVLDKGTYQTQLDAKTDYIIIESRAHIPGYLDGDGTCSKRPVGAILAATRVVESIFSAATL